jgi:hypothetical protein
LDRGIVGGHVSGGRVYFQSADAADSATRGGSEDDIDAPSEALTQHEFRLLGSQQIAGMLQQPDVRPSPRDLGGHTSAWM